MVGVLIITHGHLGRELKKTASMISGFANDVKAISFLPGQGIEELKEKVEKTLSRMNTEEGIICLVDIPGGSPARVAASMIFDYELLQVVSGINLAMLVEVLLMRDCMNIYELTKYVENSARESILNIREIFDNELKKDSLQD